MSLFAQVILAATLFLFLTVSAMALCAKVFGIEIRRITYGLGPTIFMHGKVEIRALPFSGHVKLKDSRAEPFDTHETANDFNHQPVWKQVVLPLSGAGSALLLALVVLGPVGWVSFIAAFAQIVDGALGPVTSAQTSLAAFSTLASTQPFLTTFAFVATKLAALNMIPTGGSNSAQAITSLLKWGRPTVPWEDALHRWLLVPAILICAGWFIAVVYYVSH